MAIRSLIFPVINAPPVPAGYNGAVAATDTTAEIPAATPAEKFTWEQQMKNVLARRDKLTRDAHAL